MQGPRVNVPPRAVGLAICLALALAACGGAVVSETPNVTTTAPPPATGPAATPSPAPSGPTAEVLIAEFAYGPAQLTVAAGTTVTWTNQDGAAHTATADDGSFKSGSLGRGQAFSVTLDTPGTFAYHCAIHPRMIATVVVTP